MSFANSLFILSPPLCFTNDNIILCVQYALTAHRKKRTSFLAFKKVVSGEWRTLLFLSHKIVISLVHSWSGKVWRKQETDKIFRALDCKGRIPLRKPFSHQIFLSNNLRRWNTGLSRSCRPIYFWWSYWRWRWRWWSIIVTILYCHVTTTTVTLHPCQRQFA